MLPSHQVADNGLCLIEENPLLVSNIRAHVGDLDVEGSYPYGECCFNVSKETTKRELIDIVGVEDKLIRYEGINLSGGFTNATEIATNLFGLPTFDTLLDSFVNQV